MTMLSTMQRALRLAFGIALVTTLTLATRAQDPAAQTPIEPFRDTAPLEWQDDIASRLVDGADRFLLGELAKSVAAREAHWNRDTSSPEAYAKSLEPNRERLKHILGVRDPRIEFDGIQLEGSTAQPALVGRTDAYRIFKVRWPAIQDVYGEGLLIIPAGSEQRAVADVIAIPDADQLPEMLAGLVDGTAPESQFARRLAESNCRVLIPMLIDRTLERRNGRANVTNREFLYRSAFELGRHLIGYELQKVLAGVDWFQRDAIRRGTDRPIGVIGWGEGGMLALYAGAIDPRIDAVAVSGHFGPRETIWQQPIDRNVFGLLEQFGDAELAAMIAPRRLTIEAAMGPELELPSEGGAPAVLKTFSLENVQSEFARAQSLVAGLPPAAVDFSLVVSGDGRGPAGSTEALQSFLRQLGNLPLAEPGAAPESRLRNFDPTERQKRQFHEIDRYNQWLLTESPYVRQEFMSKLDTSSLEAYAKSVESYRDFFRHEVIGHYPYERMPFNPRTRKAYDEEKWTGYELVLDVFPEVIAYGVLLLPKDIQPGEKRPVVVCQHGLEGRPQDIITGDNPAYHDFAAKLAERGFITFAPQNLYIFQDRFRTLQRKSNPLKKTLFSIIVPQHQQIVDWLKTLPEVDSERIGFYGLSYGGKSAMRIPPLVTDYCLSICSADFNEWVWKNASSRAPQSYVWTGEYEIFEFDLGSTFNYAEMAALIAPRPFMVERGHFDGVAPDETVGYEFAKVRFLYQGLLKLKDRCEIEWFDGPHTINGQGTFEFLHKHLKWEKRE